MKRSLITLAASSMLVLGLAACSDDAEQETPLPNPAPVETTETETAEEEVTEEATEEVEEDAELDEAEAQQGAAAKLDEYYKTLMADNEAIYAENAVFGPGEEAPSVAELVEFGENEASVVMDHFHLDEDFTNNEKAVLVISGVMANSMMSMFGSQMEEQDIAYTIVPEEISIEGNKAEVEPGDIAWTVGGEAVDMEEQAGQMTGMVSSSYLIYVDGEWHMDGRTTLEEALSLSGSTTEQLLEEMGVQPE